MNDYLAQRAFSRKLEEEADALGLEVGLQTFTPSHHVTNPWTDHDLFFCTSASYSAVVHGYCRIWSTRGNRSLGGDGSCRVSIFCSLTSRLRSALMADQVIFPSWSLAFCFPTEKMPPPLDGRCPFKIEWHYFEHILRLYKGKRCAHITTNEMAILLLPVTHAWFTDIWIPFSPPLFHLVQNLSKLLPKAMEIYRKSPLRTRKLEDEEKVSPPSTAVAASSSPLATNTQSPKEDGESKGSEAPTSTSSSTTSVASS